MLPCESWTVPTSTFSLCCFLSCGFVAQKAASWWSSQASKARLFRRSASLSAQVIRSSSSQSTHGGHCLFSTAFLPCDNTCACGVCSANPPSTNGCPSCNRTALRPRPIMKSIRLTRIHAIQRQAQGNASQPLLHHSCIPPARDKLDYHQGSH